MSNTVTFILCIFDVSVCANKLWLYATPNYIQLDANYALSQEQRNTHVGGNCTVEQPNFIRN